MDYFLFQRITEDMRVSGIEEIGVFFLGESTMSPVLLIKAIAWIKGDLGFPYCFLTSNATKADEYTVGGMMGAGLDSLKWSVNFADEKQFSDMTGGSATLFDRAIGNIKQAWEIRKESEYKTMLSASSILYDLEHKERMNKLLVEKILPYVDNHYWLPLYQMAINRQKIKDETGYEPTAGNMGRVDSKTLLPTRKPLPCWSAFTEGHVRVDGGLSACCFGADDRFDMGLLDGTNFMRQWNSPKFQNLRKAQLNTLTDGQDALIGTPCGVCVAYK